MRDTLTTLLGKAVRRIARLRGGGSALPGLVVERLDRGYLARMLGKLEYGVVVVSGTNGKTTTTKMVVEILESLGLTVFTNRTGSNFSRGIVAALVAESSATGKLESDIAVLELDEAHAMYFINRVPPRHTLLLNVLRDQLDRFGEVDVTAGYLDRIAQATTHGVLVNREDPLVNRIGERIEAADESNDSDERRTVERFGLSDGLRSLFPSDGDLARARSNLAPLEQGGQQVADVTLISIDGNEAIFEIDGEHLAAEHQLEGVYNVFNAAAALALVRLIVRDHAIRVTNRDLLKALGSVKPAFGRGERLELDGQPFELVLVKNPAGFQLALTSFPARGTATMIAINDAYADGRDVSWLWDVDFRSLEKDGVDTVAGARAWDMVLRLEHDGVGVGTVEEHLGRALAQFRERTPGVPRRIYCTYTAMLELRQELSELTEVEDIW